MSFAPRARYYEDKAPESYLRANTRLLANAGLPALGYTDFRSVVTAAESAHVAITRVPSDWLRLPVEQAIQEMVALRDSGFLTALRGNRLTDLPRGIAGSLGAKIKERCPALRAMLDAVQVPLLSAGLFVRAVKLDEPRASTTSPSENACSTNLHFDYGGASLVAEPEPLFQYYVNAARLPRMLRVLPCEREHVLRVVAETEPDGLETVRGMPLKDVLSRFLQLTPNHLVEEVIVEQGRLAIFDGRAWAHDGAKADVEALARGEWAPAAEKDFVFALDRVDTPHTGRYYSPSLAFFDDPASEQYWLDMKSVRHGSTALPGVLRAYPET